MTLVLKTQTAKVESFSTDVVLGRNCKDPLQHPFENFSELKVMKVGIKNDCKVCIVLYCLSKWN